MSKKLEEINILFCGSSELSIGVLNFLKSKNIFPKAIITQPDKPVGRKKILTETIVSSWARENSIQCLKPEKFNEEFLRTLLTSPYKREEDSAQVQFDLCLVASYGKILKKNFLDIFNLGVWNVHPSELPKYRGATPLQAQIIDGLKEITVTVIKMDEGMDSGDILEQKKMQFDWENKDIEVLEHEAGILGGEIFFENFSTQNSEDLILNKQNHANATFTKILFKEDGNVSKEIQDKNIDLIWRKFNAYKNWPGIYFVRPHMRVKITAMQKDVNTGEIKILKLLPESKKEISLLDFENSYGSIF